jgi:hypothetical protein
LPIAFLNTIRPSYAPFDLRKLQHEVIRISAGGSSSAPFAQKAFRVRFISSHLTFHPHLEDVRGLAKLATAKHRLLKRFPKLEDEKRLDAMDADSILWSALYLTSVVDEGEEEPEEVLKRISIPGIPEDAEWEDFESWTAGMVRAGLEAIAGATGEDAEELLEVITDAARREAAKAKQQAEQVERELANMSRERLLPSEKTLEKITRYEAHLSRQMFKALHELEALQVRRSGGAAPLARLDVDGLSQE